MGVKFYYAIKIMNDVVKYGTWKEGVIFDNETSTNGSDCGAFVGTYSTRVGM